MLPARDQEIRSTVLAKLADEATLPAPAIMVVGRVVAEVAEEISREFRIGLEPSERTSPTHGDLNASQLPKQKIERSRRRIRRGNLPAMPQSRAESRVVYVAYGGHRLRSERRQA